MKIRVLIALLIVVVAIGYLFFQGVKESITYYITPKELIEKQNRFSEKRIRLGGFVESLTKDITSLEYLFELSDGERNVYVLFRGVPPDLFSQGKGAVVEGRWNKDKQIFEAEEVMAKHGEDYRPPKIKKR